MARYYALTEPNDSGEQDFVAKLEMDGYVYPEFWEGEERVNEYWPESAVSALIFLFTNRLPLEDMTGEGIEIPDSLGWHIALLMDFWSDDYCGLGDEAGGLGTDFSSGMLREYMAFRAGGDAYPSQGAIGYLDMKVRYEHAKHRRNVVQQWYSDGIQLFQATSLRADYRDR